MRKYESEGKYTVRNLVKNKAIALELAEIYVKNRYGQDAAEEEKPYEISELTTSWVVEGTIHSDQIAGGVFIIEIGKNDGRIQVYIQPRIICCCFSCMKQSLLCNITGRKGSNKSV